MTRFFPLAALSAASLLTLAACQEDPQQPGAEVQANDSASAALDTGVAPPGTTATARTDTAAGSAMTSGTQGGGIDTTGSGPASIPQGRYTTTGSGLKYYDLQEGSGASPSGPSASVRVHYTGWLQSNGEKFDSSYDRGEPITFPLDGVIEGWTEGLQSMSVGGTRQLVIPSDLAYGQRGSGPIPPGSTLIFEVKLLGLEGA